MLISFFRALLKPPILSKSHFIYSLLLSVVFSYEILALHVCDFWTFLFIYFFCFAPLNFQRTRSPTASPPLIWVPSWRWLKRPESPPCCVPPVETRTRKSPGSRTCFLWTSAAATAALNSFVQVCPYLIWIHFFRSVWKFGCSSTRYTNAVHITKASSGDRRWRDDMFDLEKMLKKKQNKTQRNFVVMSDFMDSLSSRRRLKFDSKPAILLSYADCYQTWFLTTTQAVLVQFLTVTHEPVTLWSAERELFSRYEMAHNPLLKHLFGWQWGLSVIN